MVKRERYTATHLDTDSAPDKRDATSYYAAYNLEVVNNGRLLSINPTKTKGEYSSFTFATLVGDVIIDGVLYLFEHKEGDPYPDSIYGVSKVIAPATTPTITEIVSSNYGWSDDTQLDVVGNRENENIIKVYWADSVNQLRALNVVDAPYPDGTVADIVLPVSLSKPTAEIIQGGNLIAGKVQYAYSLFNLHGVESVISNLSQPLSISYDMEGGESGEVMPLSAEVTLDSIDTTFEYIRIYSIHYQEANQVPKITLIYETKITGATLTLIDDGNLFISELSYEQFVFLGGVLVIPKTIASKDNRLFAANYETTNFDIPDDEPTLDSRVFGFKELAATPEAWGPNTHLAETWAPAIISHTPVTYTPEAYAFSAGVHSSPNSYTGRAYASIPGGSPVISWALLGANDASPDNISSIAAYGGIGWYEINLQIDLLRTSGSGSTTANVIVKTSLAGVDRETINVSPYDWGGVFSTTQSENYTFDFKATLTFDEIHVTITNSLPAEFTMVANSWGWKLNDWEALLDVPIANPGNSGIWKDYNINDVEHGGVNTLDIGGNYYTPDSVVFDDGSGVADFIFYTNPGVLVPGNNYSGSADVNTAGVRTHIDDVHVYAEIDATQVFSGYNSITITSAIASGNAIMIASPYTSHVIIGQVLSDPDVTLDLGVQLLSAAMPAGTEVAGISIASLILGGMRTSDTGAPELKVKTAAGVPTIYTTPADVPLTHDAINPDYEVYNLQNDIVTIGYSGTNFALSFASSNSLSKKYLKQGEVYRIGIVYYNEYMQRTPVKWMCDIRTPYASPDYGVYLRAEFIGTAQDFKDVGVASYQLVVVKREPKDRTVSSPGFIVPGVDYEWQNDGSPVTGAVHPYYTLKRILSGTEGGDIKEDYTSGYDFAPLSAGYFNAAVPVKDDTVMFFYSSDTVFAIDSLYPPTAIRILGSARAATNTVPSTHGDTKITLKQDGGVYDSAAIDDLLYFDLTTQVPLMPVGLMRIINVSAPAGVLQFEHILQHTYTTIVDPPDTYDNIVLSDSVILKEGESNNLSSIKVANTVNIKKLVELNEGDARIVNYAASFAGSVALKFSSADWHVDPDVIVDWSKFAISTTDVVYLPLIELLREVINQYGGATYEDKQKNNYLLNGEVSDIDTSGVITNYIGDVYLGPLNINRSDGLNTFNHAYWNVYDYVYIPRLEHNVDINSRHDNMYSWSMGLDTQTSYELYRLTDNHQLLGSYNQQNELILGISKPVTFTDVEIFNASIIASKQKFPNEVIDSWTDFLVNDTMNLDGIYGDITKLYNFTNEIFSFQERAVSGITINPRIQIQADDGVGVELGTGTVLYRYKYLTTKSGTKQIWSVTDDGVAIFYYDDVAQSINVHTGEEMSTVKKIRNLMRGLTMPLDPADLVVRSIYDIGKQDVIFVFEDTSIVYNKYIGEFIRTEDIHDYIHVFNNKVFSLVSGNLNEHYAGTNYNPMHITYMFAPMPTMDKVFHNIEYRKIGDNNFNYILAEDTIGRSGLINSPDIFNKFNINRIHIPRVNGTMERFRDVNILLTLQCPQSADLMSVDDMVLMYNIKG